MKRNEIPMMRDVLAQAIQCDARAFAVLWAMSRLSYRLREKGDLTDFDIEKMFDPVRAQQSLSEGYREKVRETIQGLQDYCLGRTETLSNHFAIGRKGKDGNPSVIFFFAIARASFGAYKIRATWHSHSNDTAQRRQPRGPFLI